MDNEAAVITGVVEPIPIRARIAAMIIGTMKKSRTGQAKPIPNIVIVIRSSRTLKLGNDAIAGTAVRP